MPETAPSLRRRLAARWARLSSLGRRRIVLGTLVALSVAALDVLLLIVAGSLFALSELAPAPKPKARAA